MTALDATVRLRRDDAFELDVRVVAEARETIALLGRNGAGKSSLLSAVAGIEPITAGCIRVDDLVVDDPQAHTFVPADRRRVGLLLQQPTLFPHLSALENVAFGLRTSGLGRQAARAAAAAALERRGLGELAGRRPEALSGGQAARVALVRALVRRPAVLLLDEPLAAIDADAREGVRAALAADLEGFGGATVIVTHDVHDAAALASRVIVLDAGRIVQQGTLAQLQSSPADPVVTRLTTE